MRIFSFSLLWKKNIDMWHLRCYCNGLVPIAELCAVKAVGRKCSVDAPSSCICFGCAKLVFLFVCFIWLQMWWKTAMNYFLVHQKYCYQSTKWGKASVFGSLVVFYHIGLCGASRLKTVPTECGWKLQSLSAYTCSVRWGCLPKWCTKVVKKKLFGFCVACAVYVHSSPRST